MKIVLFLLFIGVPTAEIATFIKVGDIIGLWPTIATIILTAIVGASLIRAQGLKTLAEAQIAAQEGRLPIDAVIEGVFLLIAALLLLTPGFITDAIGFLLLWRPLRLSIAKWLWVRIRDTADIHVTREQYTNNTTYRENNNGPIIEGSVISSNEKTHVEDEGKPAKNIPDSKSPWTKR